MQIRVQQRIDPVPGRGQARIGCRQQLRECLAIDVPCGIVNDGIGRGPNAHVGIRRQNSNGGCASASTPGTLWNGDFGCSGFAPSARGEKTVTAAARKCIGIPAQGFSGGLRRRTHVAVLEGGDS
ncbi:MAG: hypothetical protein AMXMBFR25_12960 [Lysobacterales bacterium]